MSVKTAAIVVTYNPNSCFYLNIESISKQVDMVYLYDNSDKEKVDITLFLNKDNVHVEYSDINVGIATALNSGLEFLLNRFSPEFIFTFDQDTRIPQGFVLSMIDSAIDLLEIDNSLVLLAPRMLGNLGELIGNKGETKEKVRLAITSASMLVSSNLWFQKPFPDHYFIDHVDHHFCLTAYQHERSIWIDPNIVVEHELGESRYAKFFGLVPFRYQYHSPLRNYYFFRNGILLLREKAVTFFALYFLKTAVKKILKIVLIQPKKFENLSSVFKGIRDGINNTIGPYHG